MVGIDNVASATDNTAHEQTTAMNHTTLQHHIQQSLSLNQAHKALNDIWRACFARNNTTNTTLPVLAAILQPENNQSWGPDTHTGRCSL
jgi:hypothetical protein